eukprot:7744388-Lingulodinium_polyedra.AAC.1
MNLKESDTYNPEKFNEVYLKWARVASSELTANLGAPVKGGCGYSVKAISLSKLRQVRPDSMSGKD